MVILFYSLVFSVPVYDEWNASIVFWCSKETISSGILQFLRRLLVINPSHFHTLPKKWQEACDSLDLF